MTGRTILVEGYKRFKVTLPPGATLTFGPWSPPNSKAGDPTPRYDTESKRGTLRVYLNGPPKECIAVFSGVTSYRDLSLGYSEEVVKEEGATIWRDDEKGYYRDAKVERKREWHPALEQPENLSGQGAL